MRVSNNAKRGASKRIARSKQEIQSSNRHRNDQHGRRKRVCQLYPRVGACRGLSKLQFDIRNKHETIGQADMD